ncbi:MAG: hypothetical protein V1811_00615 [Candidatus Micrarchaeota archaeon]
MKKTIVLLVLLLPLVAFAAKECVKSDFSNQHFKNLTNQGTAEQVVLGSFFKDECTGVAQLKEYYCFNAFLRSSEEACPSGLYCTAGACRYKFDITQASYVDRMGRVETNLPATCFISNALISDPVETDSVFQLSSSIDGLRHSKVKEYSGQKAFFLCKVNDGYQLAAADAVIKSSPLSTVVPLPSIQKPVVVSEAVKIDYGTPLVAVFLLFIAFLYLWLSMPAAGKKRK